MAYQLSIDTGKPNSRRVRRQASPHYVSSLTADDGNTRVEVELSPFGRIDISIMRDDTHEAQTLSIPPMRADMKPDMPTLITIDGQGWRKQGRHVVTAVEYHEPNPAVQSGN